MGYHYFSRMVRNWRFVSHQVSNKVINRSHTKQQNLISVLSKEQRQGARAKIILKHNIFFGNKVENKMLQYNSAKNAQQINLSV